MPRRTKSCSRWAPARTLVPGAPTLTGSVSNTTVTLAWTRSAGAGPSNFVCPRGGTAPGASNLFSGNVGSGTQLTATVTAGTYYLRVRGVNAAGVGAASNETMLTVTGCALPATPTGLTFTRSGNVVTVMWNATPGAVAYFLEAGTAPGARNLFNGSVGHDDDTHDDHQSGHLLRPTHWGERLRRQSRVHGTVDSGSVTSDYSHFT